MKKLSYLFILLLFPIVAFAQEATVQDKENKEKIKEIKLSEDYVYADAVTEENLSEAQQNSMDLLRKRYFRRTFPHVQGGCGRYLGCYRGQMPECDY